MTFDRCGVPIKWREEFERILQKKKRFVMGLKPLRSKDMNVFTLQFGYKRRSVKPSIHDMAISMPP